MTIIHQENLAAREERSRATLSFNTEESKTLLGPAAECDLNNIVRAFGASKIVPPPNADDPRWYGDLTDAPDLRTALDRIREADARFMALPAELRAMFNNSPAMLWGWINDPSNLEEAVELGLLSRRPAPPAPPPPPAP